MMTELTNMIPLLMTIIGALAIVVSVIIQVIKNIGIFAKVQTDILVIILSIVLSILAVLWYTAANALPILWYYIVGALLGGFFVAFIAMFGWTKLKEIVDRFKK